MSYSNGHITAPVSIHDVQRALGVSSTDLATLCMHENINLWARYRPVPCKDGVNNTPNPLSESRRFDETWGIDVLIDTWAPDSDHAFEDYVNNAEFTESGGFYIHIRPWLDRDWKRLTDFVKTDNNGNGVANIGYNHKAKMDTPTVIVNNKVCNIVPLIPDYQRELYIEDGETVRFQFPNDRLWVKEYVKYVKGIEPNNVSAIYRNEEYLSSLDFLGLLGSSTQIAVNDFTKLRRVLCIFKWWRLNEASEYYWKLWNKVYDRVVSDQEDRPYDSTNKNAWVDFSRYANEDNWGDMSYDDNAQYNHPETDTDENAWKNLQMCRDHPSYETVEKNHEYFLRNLEGRFLFLEIWGKAGAASSIDVLPIEGLAYEVNIHREAAPVPPEPIHAFIENVFLYEYDGGSTSGEAIKITETTGPNYTGIEFTFYINPSNFLVDGQSFGYDTVANANLIMSRLRNFYSSLILRVGKINDVPLTFDMFMDIMEVVVEPYADPNWRKCTALMFEDNEHAVAFSDTTAEINAVIPQQLGEYKNGHDVLLVETSGF